MFTGSSSSSTVSTLCACAAAFCLSSSIQSWTALHPLHLDRCSEDFLESFVCRHTTCLHHSFSSPCLEWASSAAEQTSPREGSTFEVLDRSLYQDKSREAANGSSEATIDRCPTEQNTWHRRRRQGNTWQALPIPIPTGVYSGSRRALLHTCIIHLTCIQLQTLRTQQQRQVREAAGRQA